MKLKISSWFTLLEFTRKKDCLSWVRPSGMTAYLGAKGPVEIPWSISLPASGTSHKNVKYSQSPNVVGPHPLQVKEGAAAEECQYPLSAHVEAWETLTKPIRSHRRATRVVRCAPAVIPATAASAGLCCVSCWGSQDTTCDINYWPWVNSFCEGVFLMHLLHLACAAISLAPIKKIKKKSWRCREGMKGDLRLTSTWGWKLCPNPLRSDRCDSEIPWGVFFGSDLREWVRALLVFF